MGGLANTTQGAAGGALAGASIAGPYGAIAGGVIGGALGYFGGNSQDDQKRKLEQYYAEQAKRTVPQLGAAATADYSGFRENQSNLVNHLEAMSQGRGPSLASEQFKKSTDRNIAQQQALAMGGYGNTAARMMMAANNSAQLGAQSTQDAGIAKIQEQQMALNQLGLTLHGAREADEGMNRFNTSSTNNFAIANMDAKLRAQGMSDGTRLQILQQMSGGGPSMGESILAGGAGMFAQGAAMKSNNRGNQPTWGAGQVPYRDTNTTLGQGAGGQLQTFSDPRYRNL